VKSRDLIEALLAVLGVYQLIQGLSLAVLIIPFGSRAQEADSWPSLSIAIGAVVPIVLGACLLTTRGKLADRLSSSSEAAPTAAPDNLLETLLGVCGVYFVVSALAAGASVLTGDYLRADFLSELSGQVPRLDEKWAPRIRVLVQLGLGVGLAVGSSGVAAALRSIRAAGRRRTAV